MLLHNDVMYKLPERKLTVHQKVRYSRIKRTTATIVALRHRSCSVRAAGQVSNLGHLAARVGQR